MDKQKKTWFKKLFKHTKKQVNPQNENNMNDHSNNNSNDKNGDTNKAPIKLIKIGVQITDLVFGISELKEFSVPQLNKDPQIQEFICLDRLADNEVFDFILERFEIKSLVGGDVLYFLTIVDDGISMITCIFVKAISEDLRIMLAKNEHLIRIKR